ncbi:MAG: M48 family metallopeptidase [Rhodococcus sp. (in: high G+C Gram-positive bacteria)]
MNVMHPAHGQNWSRPQPGHFQPPPVQRWHISPAWNASPAPRGLMPHERPARHPWEIPLLAVAILLSVVTYVTALIAVALGLISTWILVVLAAPILIAIARGQLYGSQQVNGIKMSPTQFPDGYRMVAEAAARLGMAQPPDAYVVLGNGRINAFASGHGFRRFVVVYSDLFEVGGAAREPDALAFIIGHEVGHIAAGHASYWRQLGQFASHYIPVVGSALSRSMEYTADNHGYCVRPHGARGAMGVLGAGKYLVSVVGFDELADRATTERGFFPWFVNLLSSHPVLTWRAAALRDRTRHGALFTKPDRIYRDPQQVRYATSSPAGPVSH